MCSTFCFVTRLSSSLAPSPLQGAAAEGAGLAEGGGQGLPALRALSWERGGKRCGESIW